MRKFWPLGIWSLFIVCNFLLGNWNLTSLFAEDKIVAVVNNDVITQKDLDDFLNFTRIQLSRQYSGKELEAKEASIKSDLLERLIEDKLILQEAKKEKINPDAGRIKAKINEIKKRYNSDKDFQDELAKQGLTQADIENKIRDQFLMFVIIEQKIRNRINVKPEEVTELYQKSKAEFKAPEEREVEAFALDNEDLASSFAYYLKLDKPPEELATRYPFTVNKFNVRLGEGLKKEIEEAVFKLGLNEISDPIKMDDKYYVFKLLTLIPARQYTLQESQNKIQSFLFEKKMQEDLVKWLDELKKQSYINIK